MVLLLLSYVCFFNFFSSIMGSQSNSDNQITFFDLKTTEDKNVTFFADYTDSTSLRSVDIKICPDRKIIALVEPSTAPIDLDPLSRAVDIKDAIAALAHLSPKLKTVGCVALKEEFALDRRPINFMKFGETVYHINKMEFLKNKKRDDESKKSPVLSRWDSLPAKLFVTATFFICVIALLRYFNCRTLYKPIG